MRIFASHNLKRNKMTQETLEEFIESQPYYGTCTTEYKEGIEVGAKWQQEQNKNKYSKEDILINIELAMIQGLTLGEYRDLLIEQFKKK